MGKPSPSQVVAGPGQVAALTKVYPVIRGEMFQAVGRGLRQESGSEIQLQTEREVVVVALGFCGVQPEAGEFGQVAG
jgi:hypothetical protein